MRVNNISQLLEDMTRRFSASTDTPTLDAQVLLAHITNQSRAWILAHPEYSLSSTELDRLNNAISKFENGVPLPYILGYREFYRRNFLITPDVLIPRPETELLVEMALHWVDNRFQLHPNDKILAADIGCGSGCIGISLAIDHPSLQVIASDVSLAALKVTCQNAVSHSVSSRLHPVQCNMIPPIVSRFHLICANLPYIPTQTLYQLKVYTNEPTLALDGGEYGLDVINKLLLIAPRYLAAGGMMLLEIASTQGETAKKLAQSAFPHAVIHLYRDLAGHDRVITIQ